MHRWRFAGGGLAGVLAIFFTMDFPNIRLDFGGCSAKVTCEVTYIAGVLMLCCTASGALVVPFGCVPWYRVLGSGLALGTGTGDRSAGWPLIGNIIPWH